MTTAAMETPAVTTGSMFALKCVACGSVPVSSICSCGFVFETRDGILRALVPERAHYFARFQQEYGQVRAQEGRGAADDGYYLGLPFEDRSGHNVWQWAIRGATYRHFVRRILPRIERRAGRPLNILDIGAGNGWMSYRLTLRGHHCAAVDLLDNAWDGLGATPHYLRHLHDGFAVVQAEMDRLPFDDRQFDVAIFNASFHYSMDYSRTLRETLRCLRNDGDMLILDTPYYHREESGRAMVRERQAQYESRYGFRSDSIPSREYVTRTTMAQLSGECGIHWQVHRPWHGWAWAWRPWKARLQGRREPSKFHTWWGRREA